jgi:hypothetical protein
MQHSTAMLQRKVEYHEQKLAFYEAELEAAVKREVRKLSKNLPTNTVKRKTGPVSKIDFVYALVEASKKKGLSPAQIKEMSVGKSIAKGKGYPYVMLWKLKNEGSVKERSGRYFVVPGDSK